MDRITPRSIIEFSLEAITKYCLASSQSPHDLNVATAAVYTKLDCVYFPSFFTVLRGMGSCEGVLKTQPPRKGGEPVSQTSSSSHCWINERASAGRLTFRSKVPTQSRWPKLSLGQRRSISIAVFLVTIRSIEPPAHNADEVITHRARSKRPVSKKNLTSPWRTRMYGLVSNNPQ